MSDVNKQLLFVAVQLVKFQGIYEKNTGEQGCMPGNETYGEMLMRIVDCAKEAIAAAEQAKAEPVAYGKTPGCKQCDEAEACGLTFCPECDAQFCEGHDGAEEGTAQPPAVADRDAIRRIFMAHGFTIKEGQADLKPYVYEAAEALLRELSPAVAVPKGWQLVPTEPTPEIMAAAAIAAWPRASEGDVNMAKQAAIIVMKSMDAQPGVTLEMLAATLATMAPAYRAMLAASKKDSAVHAAKSMGRPIVWAATGKDAGPC